MSSDYNPPPDDRDRPQGWPGEHPVPPTPPGGQPSQYALAGFWIRFAGAIVDGLIIGVVNSVLAAILGDVTGLLGFAVSAAYFTFLHSTKAGQSLGQRLCGIRVIDQRTGGQVAVGNALARWAMSLVSGIALFIGYLWMLGDRQKQTWHDKVAGTLVVHSAQHPPPTTSLLER